LPEIPSPTAGARPAATGRDPVLKIGTGSGAPGQTVVLPVTLRIPAGESPTAFSGFDIVVGFDTTRLAFVSASGGSFTSGMSFNINAALGTGVIGVSGFTSGQTAALASGDGAVVIANLTFAIASGASAGTTPVNLRAHDGGQVSTAVFDDLAAAAVLLPAPSNEPNDEGDGSITVMSAATPPRVTGVYVRGSSWNATYLAMSPFTKLGSTNLGWRLPDGTSQLSDSSTVSWNNIDTLSIQFDRPVAQMPADALQLILGTTSGNAAIIPTVAPTLHEAGTIATWRLPADYAYLRRGQHMISLSSSSIASLEGAPLDGNWATGSSTYAAGSGDGTAGGDFEFVFNALVGDVQANGRVSPQDITAARAALQSVFGTLPGNDTFRFDIDGSGRISPSDLTQIRSQLTSAFGTPSTALSPVQRAASMAFSQLADLPEEGGSAMASAKDLVFAELATTVSPSTVESDFPPSVKKKALRFPLPPSE
jgi:hypothetical protein